MFRVYLIQDRGWREFGIDYTTREAADNAANAYRESFPYLRYIVRRCAGRRLSQFVAVTP